MSLESSCWEVHRGQSERGQCVSCCCHRTHEVDLAHPWAGLPRCVHVSGLRMWQSRALPRRLLAPSVCSHLTVKSCHSLLGVFKSCPGSAGCSKVEIKANLLLWLRKTLVTSALILSEEIRDAPAPRSGDGGQAPLSATLLD